MYALYVLYSSRLFSPPWGSVILTASTAGISSETYHDDPPGHYRGGKGEVVGTSQSFRDTDPSQNATATQRLALTALPWPTVLFFGTTISPAVLPLVECVWDSETGCASSGISLAEYLSWHG